MPIANSLIDQTKLLFGYAQQEGSDMLRADAEQTVELIQEILSSERFSEDLEMERRLSLKWRAEPNRKGGRRSFDEYRQRFTEYGFETPRGADWKIARDNVRTLEEARMVIGLGDA